jgi:regulatory protein
MTREERKASEQQAGRLSRQINYLEHRSRSASRQAGDENVPLPVRGRRGGAAARAGEQSAAVETPERLVRSRVRPIDRDFLHAAALRYLNRYDASESKLLRVLLRSAGRARMRQGCPDTPSDADLLQWAEEVVERLVQSRLVSDQRLAEGLCRTLRQRGLSRRAVVQRLRARGIRAEVIEALVQREQQEEVHADLQAARVFVNKRRLGHVREPAAQKEHRARDLAKLARAGFSSTVARRALAPQDEDAF